MEPDIAYFTRKKIQVSNGWRPDSYPHNDQGNNRANLLGNALHQVPPKEHQHQKKQQQPKHQEYQQQRQQQNSQHESTHKKLIHSQSQEPCQNDQLVYPYHSSSMLDSSLHNTMRMTTNSENPPLLKNTKSRSGIYRKVLTINPAFPSGSENSERCETDESGERAERGKKGKICDNGSDGQSRVRQPTPTPKMGSNRDPDTDSGGLPRKHRQHGPQFSIAV